VRISFAEFPRKQNRSQNSARGGWEDFFDDLTIGTKYFKSMPDLAKLHDEKYKRSREAGLPGWGGADRIANLPKMIDERFLSFESLPRSGKLLEIGCGAGNISIELANRGYEVTGVDFSEAAIAWARENAVAAQIDVEFKVADVIDLSFYNSGSFDIVFDGNCVHCLMGEKREATFQEIFRVLKPSGLFFVSSLSSSQLNSDFPETFDARSRILFENGAPYRFIPTPEFLEREMTNSGFKVLKSYIRKDSPFSHSSIHLQKPD
jgi:SAM-dependent methyltransferase